MPLIRGKQLTASAITPRELATDAVETAKIDDLAVTTAKIAALNVTTAKIALLAVDTGQLAAGAVTEGKLDGTLEASLIRTDGSQAFAATQSMGGFALTNVLDPTSDQDAATKAYVDATSSGLDVKASVRVTTDAALPASTASAGPGVGRLITADAVGVLTVDGVATVLGDRILVKNQVAGDDNGIYEVTTEGTAGVEFELTRATDADEDAEVTAGMFTFTEEGTLNADNGFVLSTNDPIVVDTTTLVFSQFSGAGQITAGTGLTKSGNTINAIGGDGIQANADELVVDLLASGGLKFTTGELGIEPNDFAGTGLEDDGSDNLRLAAQGNGIAGGAGSTLSVDSDTETGSNIQGVNITANGVGVDIAAIAGTGIEADGSANLRLATQGTGISGGGGSTLSFDATAADGNGLTGTGSSLAVTADTVATDNSEAVVVGANGVSINGDVVDIDYSETNYTPATTGTGVDVNDLAAHLEGIDDALGSIAGSGSPEQEAVTTEVITGTDTAITDTLNSAPTSNASVSLFLNGVHQESGAGNDYTLSSQTITWLAATGTAVDMDTGDVLIAIYES